MKERSVREVCALLHDGQVLTDARGRLRSVVSDDPWSRTLADRARTSGDPAAVLVAPQLQARADPQVLVDVFASRGEPEREGTWTALADVSCVADGDEAAVVLLQEASAQLAGVVPAPARRPDWFRVSWYDEVEAWVDGHLARHGRRRTGPCVPAKVWSLSAVLEVPCEPGSSVWLKASCRHFHAEPALTALVARMMPEHAPPVIATHDERAWTLMAGVPGADEHTDEAPPPAFAPAAARVTAALHLASSDHLAEIEAAGVPVRTLADTGRRFDEILTGSIELDQLTADELAAARGMRDDVHAVLDELAGLGVPDTLVHGDLHLGNVARDGDAIVLYDWSDAAVSHPFLDLVLLASRLPDDERHAARTAYTDAWRTACPDLDVARALALAEPANVIYQMVTFEQIQRAQEDASVWEMSGVVARMLRTLPERVPRPG